MILGFDFGGVIIERAQTGADTAFFSDDFLDTPEMPGAINGIARLGQVAANSGNLWIVSKASARTQAKTRLWLASRDFYNRTGIAEDQVVFTDTRDEKAEIADILEMTAFVDDQLAVLRKMKGIVPYLFHLDIAAAERTDFAESFSSWEPLTERLLGLEGSHGE